MPQHDGSLLRLRKLHADYDPTDRIAAMSYMHAMQAAGEMVTGLLYVDPQATDLHTALNTVPSPLNRLGEAELCPGAGSAGEASTPVCADRAGAGAPCRRMPFSRGVAAAAPPRAAPSTMNSVRL